MPAAIDQLQGVGMGIKNWQTKLSGIAGLVVIAARIYSSGHFDWGTDVPAIMAGIGVISAKQHNVTGGTKEQ